jgi:hypothetical protein
VPKADTLNRGNYSRPMFWFGEQIIDLSDGLIKLLVMTQLLKIRWSRIVTCATKLASDLDPVQFPHGYYTQAVETANSVTNSTWNSKERPLAQCPTKRKRGIRR